MKSSTTRPAPFLDCEDFGGPLDQGPPSTKRGEWERGSCGRSLEANRVGELKQDMRPCQVVKGGRRALAPEKNRRHRAWSKIHQAVLQAWASPLRLAETSAQPQPPVAQLQQLGPNRKKRDLQHLWLGMANISHLTVAAGSVSFLITCACFQEIYLWENGTNAFARRITWSYNDPIQGIAKKRTFIARAERLSPQVRSAVYKRLPPYEPWLPARLPFGIPCLFFVLPSYLIPIPTPERIARCR